MSHDRGARGLRRRRSRGRGEETQREAEVEGEDGVASEHVTAETDRGSARARRPVDGARQRHRAGRNSGRGRGDESGPREDGLGRRGRGEARPGRLSRRRGNKPDYVPPNEKERWVPVTSMGASEVRMLAGLSVEGVVDDINKRSIKAFVQTINDPKISRAPRGYMDDALTILSKLAIAVQTPRIRSSTREDASRMLAEVLSDRCASFHMRLKMYIANDLLHKPGKMQQLCDMFKILFESLPDSSWSCLPVEELKICIENSEDILQAGKTVLQQKISVVAEIKEDIARLRLEKNKIKAVHGDCVITWDNSEYRNLRLLPNWDEVCLRKTPAKLRPNIVDGAYESWMHYYDVQFRLLREDFIAPLRRGVCDYLDGLSGRKLRDVKVYNSVKILKPQFTMSGIFYQVCFDISHFKKCRWEHSKRLIYGSLLCLSPDNFENIILFATVSDRKPEDLKKGLVSLQFEDGAHLQYILDSKAVFVMVESIAFFEASRHILHSLQIAEVETMPFTRYIIKADCTSVSAPKYLDARTSFYDLSCLYGSKEGSRPPLVFNILECQQWPANAKSIELDQSQLDAIQQALTQEIAVIQGPPGTGKTYIGLKIVEALLRNRKVWDPDRQSPILVMCYTNHALDQFLQGILSIRLPEDEGKDGDGLASRTVVPKIVRVGGRCQNEAINEFNVENLVRKLYIPGKLRQEYSSCRDDIQASFKFTSNLKEIEEYHDSKKHTFLTLSELSDIVDEPDHVYQLSQLATATEERGHELEIWLGLWEEVEITVAENGDIISQVAIDCIPTIDTHTTDSIDIEEGNCYGEPESNDPLVIDTGIEKGDESIKDESNIDDESNPVEEMIDILGEADIEESSRVLTEDIEYFKPIEFQERIDETKSNAEEDTFLGDAEILPGTILSSGSDAEQEEDDDAQEGSATGSGSTDEHPSAMYKKVIVRQPRQDASELVQKYIFKHTMTPSQAKGVGDISELQLQQRWKLYNHWVEIKYQRMLNMKQNSFDEYSKQCEKFKKIKQSSHRYVFETHDVIGLTTTGAAKHQHVIHMVKPKVVIIEEAAEVLESHIVAALSAGTQHLILIGDHKQLRPKPNEYELVRKFNLDISLFERLVRRRLPHAMLNIQHRMRPEIAQLVHPHIYETLINHESVLRYDDVKGVSRNMFFINHEYPEETDSNLMSHTNQHEASFIVALCKYLLQQGYEKSQITILTPYTGQLLKLKNLMPKNTFFGMRVTAVDNFQGEENDIILLSLVRSNTEGQLGFLKEPNRVCVSLSRAKKGFYCIGNFKMLRANAPIWEQIMSDMEAKGYVGEGIQLQCQIHAKSTFVARFQNDFNKYAANGGCTLPCGYRLKCGHVCTETCHLQDQQHINYKCNRPCARCCKNGHNCNSVCFVECPPCTEKVPKEIPKCGHIQKVPCHKDPSMFLCKAPCSRQCAFGHPCNKTCSQPCGKCNVHIVKLMPLCNHPQVLPCHQDPASYPCKAQCSKQCVSGHPCSKTCSQPCGKCNVDVVKLMPLCNHPQVLPCHQNPASYPCKAQCCKSCERGHPCRKLCHELCRCDIPVIKEVPRCKHLVEMPCYTDPNAFVCNIVVDVLCPNKLHTFQKMCGGPMKACMVMVEKCIPTCKHTHLMPCSQNPAAYFCQASCEKLMTCYKHKCPGKCGEPCLSQCKAIVVKSLPCSHSIKVQCHESNANVQCMQQCLRILPCGHPCSEKCSSPCKTQCCEVVRQIQPCGHTLTTECHKTKALNLQPCNRKTKKTLPCGHVHSLKCSESVTTFKCTENVMRTYPCKHTAKVPCHKIIDPSTCNATCEIVLLCGHKCSGICGECYGRRMHQVCPFDVKLSRRCGHTVSTPCRGLSDSCSMKYTFSCPHVTVDLQCPERFPLCTKPCAWVCPHHRCRMMCHELCSRQRCNEQCDKLLNCGHRCFGVCGEPCLAICPECNEKEFKKNLREINLGKKGKIPKGTLFIQQRLCGHIYTVEYMDKYVDSNKSGLVRPIQCPENSCCGKIEVGYRYGTAQRRALEDIYSTVDDENGDNTVETIVGDVCSFSPIVLSYNKAIVTSILELKELIIVADCVGKDVAQLVHLLMRANEIIQYIEHKNIAVNVQQFAMTCSDLVHLSRTNKSLQFQLTEQLINDFLSENYRFLLQAHCTKAKEHLILSYPESKAKKLAEMFIAPVEDILDVLEIEHNERIPETVFKRHSESLRRLYPSHVAVTYRMAPLSRCHWLKCTLGHGFYSIAPKRDTDTCPLCISNPRP